MPKWEPYDELFDASNGGALYVRGDAHLDGTYSYSAAGVLWMDAVGDEKPYYAFVARFNGGDEIDGEIICSKYSAADCFDQATNMNVYEEIGGFDTIDDAVAAVHEYIGVQSNDGPMVAEPGTCRNLAPYPTNFDCSECGALFIRESDSMWHGRFNFCPNCGRAVER